MSSENKHHKLAIVLLNYRTPDLVTNCLESLKPELAKLDAVCCVVDNHSEDDSAERIRNWIRDNNADDKFRLVVADENRGFSAGNNVGIENNNADYYLLLNSDTFVRPGAIEILLKTADENPHAGLVSPRLEWPDETPQESCFRFPSIFSEIIASANTGVISRILKNHTITIPVSDEITTPPWASFASIIIRKEVIDELGYLDDGYFMYFEDTDYCFFARKAGWEIMNDPAARFVHLRGGSSSVKTSFANKTRIPAYYMAARSRYFYKTGGRLKFLMANLAWIAGRSISKLRELTGHEKMVSDKQAIDIWKNWKSPETPFKPN